CTPAVARVAASATFVAPLMIWFGTSVPSPSSQTYKVVSSANQRPKGNETGCPNFRSSPSPLARLVGNPGRIVIFSFLRLGGIPGALEAVGKPPASPT